MVGSSLEWWCTHVRIVNPSYPDGSDLFADLDQGLEAEDYGENCVLYDC